MNNVSIWITWEDQRRNRELSKALGAKLYELKGIDRIKNPVKKYVTGILKTLRILFKEKPSFVYCQNPSLVLSFFLVSIKCFFPFKVIVDAHNAGIFPAEGHSRLLMLISVYVQRFADLVLVTNVGLKHCVEANKGTGFVLQDKIPEISAPEKKCILKGKINFLFICSYASDEPFDEVFAAAIGLPDDVYIYVTGNYKKRNIIIKDVPDNIVLTGFVSPAEFERLLHSVDAIIDLTTRENCLVCGAYESVAVEKPMILSNTPALREYFNQGVVYTTPDATAIQNAIRYFINHQAELIEQVKKLKVSRTADWQKRHECLQVYLAKL